MKTMNRILTVMATVGLLLFSNSAEADVPYNNKDPRVQQRFNRVTVAILNPEKIAYTVKIFSEHKRLVVTEKLEEGMLSGKSFDFETSRRGWYRLVISSEDGPVFDEKLWVGGN